MLGLSLPLLAICLAAWAPSMVGGGPRTVTPTLLQRKPSKSPTAASQVTAALPRATATSPAPSRSKQVRGTARPELTSPANLRTTVTSGRQGTEAPFPTTTSQAKNIGVSTEKSVVGKKVVKKVVKKKVVKKKVKIFPQERAAKEASDILIKNLNDGWIPHERTLYFFSHDQLSWADSRKRCQAEGSVLAGIDTNDEQKFMEQEVKNLKAMYWFGVIYVHNKWTWPSGMEVLFPNWQYDRDDPQRNNGTKDIPGYCAALNGSFKNDLSSWEKIECEQRLKYMCKKLPDDTWL